MNRRDNKSIFDKKPRFLGVFISTSLLGIFIISVAVYRASYELEIIHEVNNMNRLVPNLLGQAAMNRLLQGDKREIKNLDSEYRFFLWSDTAVIPLQTLQHQETIKPTELETSRINSRGGYFKSAKQILTWTAFEGANGNRVLVLHRFISNGFGALAYVYKQRIIIPVIFYIWLMVWITFIFNHLLQNLKTYQAEMKQMALHDALTQLPNRKLLDERLSQLVKSKQRKPDKFACCLIDLNDFKIINDRLGHAYGDELLKQVSERLKGVLRDTDTAARYGGDEFILLLDQIDEHLWEQAFSRIYSTLTQPYTLLETKVCVGASLGIAIYSLHGHTSESLLLAADQAMYVAKAGGGGIHLYDPSNPPDTNEKALRCG